MPRFVRWHTPAEALAMATGTNAELLALSGKRSPYPGKLGVVEQGAQLTKMVRWFTPAEVLKMATHDNAQLLALSGPRNPYQGKLGVVEEGALADLLLVDGDPLADIALLNDPANLAVIMKDGKIYKNTVGN